MSGKTCPVVAPPPKTTGGKVGPGLPGPAHSSFKRGPPAPLNNFSSDDDDLSDSDRSSEKVTSPSLTSPCSPCSSTSSGPVYVRTVGFRHHGHAIRADRQHHKLSSKIKKKKASPFPTDLVPTPPALRKNKLQLGGPSAAVASLSTCKPKPRREPIPMRLRALPQSFWQQPNRVNNTAPGHAYSVLPSLGKQDEFNISNVTEVRPVTPPEERSKSAKQPHPPPRVIKATNTELLFNLFDGVDTDLKKKSAPLIKRGRPKNKKGPASESKVAPILGEDPYIGEALAALPLLALNEKGGGSSGTMSQLSVVTIKEGEKEMVSLPAVKVDHNYSHILSELVKAL